MYARLNLFMCEFKSNNELTQLAKIWHVLLDMAAIGSNDSDDSNSHKS